MAYNPYTDVYGIYKAGKSWYDETDETKRNTIHQNAQTYYDNLRANGYEKLADELSVSDLTRRKQLADQYKTMGMAKTRDYLYSLGKTYNMSTSDVDKLIGWDNTTGEVSFGGKKIGRPDAEVDGTTYWNDESVLDTAFKDYVDRSGITRPKATAVDQENEDLFAKYRQEYEDLKNTNPFETETAKAILAKYDLAGLQGRDNEVASAGATNGGNIDSFAAANALRQQSALVNQGQMAALEAHNQKLEHARALLSDMGVNIDRVFNQDETAKNNAVARGSEKASVTGEVPIEWTLQNDPFYREYVDENGSLKDEYKNTDFQVEIDKAKANGNNELAQKYAVLRGMKLSKWFNEYGQYANQGDVAYLSPKKTEEASQADAKIDLSYKTLNAEQEEKDKDRNLTQAQIDLERDQMKLEQEKNDYAEYNALLKQFDVSDTGPRNFIEKFLKPVYEGKETVTEEGIKTLIENNATEYGLTAESAKIICRTCGLDTDWITKSKTLTPSGSPLPITPGVPSNWNYFIK